MRFGLCRKPLAPDRLSKLEEAAARVLGRSMSVMTPRVADAAAGLLHLDQPEGGDTYSGSPPSAAASASDLTTETELGDSPDDDQSDAAEFLVRPCSVSLLLWHPRGEVVVFQAHQEGTAKITYPRRQSIAENVQSQVQGTARSLMVLQQFAELQWPGLPRIAACSSDVVAAV